METTQSDLVLGSYSPGPYSISDYLLMGLDPIAVSRGLVPGISHINKFGHNPDITTVSEDIWNGGGLYTGFDPTGAETLSISSSDGDDDAASGQGAFTVQLYGLDGDYNEINEIVTLDGQAAVTTTATFIRMNRAIIRSAGTNLQNIGAITAVQSSSGDVMMVMPATFNQTMIAAYTIPAGKSGLLTNWFLSTEKKQAAWVTAQLIIRPFGEVFQVKEQLTAASTGSSFIDRSFYPYKDTLTEKTDISIRAAADGISNAVSGGFTLLLIDDS